ncbi:MAG TPA: hypothetical protein VIN10_15040 [Bacteroidales bacterium]
MRKIWFILIISLVLLGGKLQAQQASAYMSLDTNAMMIGDHVEMQLGINVPDDFTVIWPQLLDSVAPHIEIVSKTGIDTTRTNNNLTLRQNISITSFDSGYFEIPSIEFIFHHKNDTVSYKTSTRLMYLMVNVPAVDTAQAFKAIKGPVSEPYTWREILPWVALGLAIIGLVIFLVWYIKRRRKNLPVFVKPKPTLPPHILAINQLEELRLAKVWQNGKVKEYHTQLTDIVREYLENRFHFEALEMTTDEILEEIANQKVNKEAASKLTGILQLADLVKFAKGQPTPLENDLCLTHGVDFVNETKLAIIQNAIENNSETETKEE